MIHIASCSFGKDSLATVLRLIEEGKPLDEVVFYNTGVEFDCIYEIRNRVVDILKDKNIKYTELSPDNHFLYYMMVKPIRYRNQEGKDHPYHYGFQWCGQRGIRWGTSLKTKAMKDYYKSAYGNEQVYEYVGIAADEPSRIKDDPFKLYPLVEWGMTEKDCLDYCHSKGFYWMEKGCNGNDSIELYDVLDRVSCWCCGYKNLKELKNIYIYLPEYWERLRGLQSRLSMPMKGEGKSVFDLEERFKKEIES